MELKKYVILEKRFESLKPVETSDDYDEILDVLIELEENNEDRQNTEYLLTFSDRLK